MIESRVKWIDPGQPKKKSLSKTARLLSLSLSLLVSCAQLLHPQLLHPLLSRIHRDEFCVCLLFSSFHKQHVLSKSNKSTILFNLRSKSHKLERIFLMLLYSNSYLSSCCSSRHVSKKKRSSYFLWSFSLLVQVNVISQGRGIHFKR